jgi:carboxylesterase type B
MIDRYVLRLFLLFWVWWASSSSTTTTVAQQQQQNQQPDQSSSSSTSSSSSSSSSSTTTAASSLASSFPVRVELPGLGIVQGIRRFDDQHVVDFFGGIPYASPPVGTLRWSPPQDPVKWSPHILDASQFGTDCYQIVDPVMNPVAHPDRMSEDCLYLNVFRPAITESEKTSDRLLPVMVWFHGGAFQQGSANRPEYNARRLSHEEQVIVVTVNYRLGALGFLVSRELGLTGNYGLMDQRAAMYFVKQYIRAFGGNPNSITLFGESAGAVMIGLHLQMTHIVDDDIANFISTEFYDNGYDYNNEEVYVDNRLFHKAILQSNPMGYQFRSVVVADFLGDALRRAVDCRDLECMKTESVEEIIRAQSNLMGIPRSVGGKS